MNLKNSLLLIGLVAVNMATQACFHGHMSGFSMAPQVYVSQPVYPIVTYVPCYRQSVCHCNHKAYKSCKKSHKHAHRYAHGSVDINFGVPGLNFGFSSIY